MNKDFQEEPLTHAFDGSGELVYVLDVKDEYMDSCRCPECNDILTVKKCPKHGKTPHFAHRNNLNCKGAQMSAIHWEAIQLIKKEMAVMAPRYDKEGEIYNVSAKKLTFVSVTEEDRNECDGIRPDIVGITKDGNHWAIEIRYTHEVDLNKRNIILKSGVTCLEIDVRNQTIASLRNFLLNSTEGRIWINNPIYDRRILESKYQNKENQLEKYSKYAKDKSLKIKNKTDCRNKCECILFKDQCIYKVDELYIEDVEFVVCDIAHIKRDYEETRENYHKKLEKRAPTSHIATPPPHDYAQDILDEEKLYLDFAISNMSIAMIMYTLKEKGKVHLIDNIEGIIEKCQLLKTSEGIVMLCKCNDRVYTYYVLEIWIEEGRLRYDYNRWRATFKYLAENHYNKVLKEYIVPNKTNWKDDQEDIFKTIDYCPF